MRLYHFTTQKYGLLAIKNRRLKIARISELNDPFEFLGWNTQDPGIRERLRAWKHERDQELGIVCFSRKWSNPLLWGHYAEKHKEMALGFNVPDGDMYNEVHYRRTRLRVPIARELTGGDVDDLLLTKFTAWRYESEFRCISLLARSVRDGDLYFEPFSAELKLADVIIGDRSTVSRATRPCAPCRSRRGYIL